MGQRIVNIAAIAMVGLTAVGVGGALFLQSRNTRPKDAEPRNVFSPTLAPVQRAPVESTSLSANGDAAAAKGVQPGTGSRSTAEETTQGGSDAATPKPAQRVAPPKTYTWAEVEELLAELRAGRKASPTAWLDLNDWYERLSHPQFSQAENFSQHIKNLETWKTQFPDSPTPFVVMGRAYVRYAWDARGSGVAATVSDAGWELFFQRIAEAQRLLEQAISMGVKDAEAYVVLMDVAKARSLPREQVHAWVEAGRKIDPTYYTLYIGMTDYLLPKWGGQPGEAEQFALQIADSLGGDDGLEAYAQIARHLNRDDFTKVYWGDLDLEKLRAAARILVERYPQAPNALQFAALVAWVTQDVEFARRLDPRLDKASLAVWGAEGRFEDFKRWCASAVASGGEKARVWGSFRSIASLAFAPNERYVWCSSGSGLYPMHLVDTQTGKLKQQLAGPGMGIGKFALSQDQGLIAAIAASADFRGVAVWNINNDGLPLTLPVEGLCLSLAVSPVSPLVAIHDGMEVRIVDSNSGDNKHVFELGTEGVNFLSFSPDGNALAIQASREITIWEPQSGQKIATLPAFDPFKKLDVRVVNPLLFDEQNRLLCLALLPGGDRGVARLTADGRSREVLLDGKFEPFIFASNDGNLVAASTPTPEHTFGIQIWSVESKAIVQRLPGHSSTIRAMAFSSDSKLLASATDNGEIKIWDVKADKSAAK